MKTGWGDKVVLIVMMAAVVFVLSQFTIPGTAAMRVVLGQTTGEKIAAFQEWKSVHQLADDGQFVQLRDLNVRLTSEVVKTATDLAALKAQAGSLDSEVRSISNRVWAMLVAVLAQLLNVVWGFVQEKLKRG